MRFTKMQGAGNDFILIDNIEEGIPKEHFSTLAGKLCERKFSVGADGMIVVEKPDSTADFRMLFYNSDGSDGELCGNGLRCVVRYGFEHGYCGKDTAYIETNSGVVTGQRISDSVYSVKLRDPVTIEQGITVKACGKEYVCDYVDIGNPHAIVFYPNFTSIPEKELRKICREIRYYSGFPRGANVTFCELEGTDALIARTFERGVEDFTLACGTGCGSTVSVLTLRGMVSGNHVKLTVPGGVIYVTVSVKNGRVCDVFLEGAAEKVFEGEIAMVPSDEFA